MRAVTFRDKLAFEPDHAEPRCGNGECLIRVRLAGICSTDLEITRGYMNFRGILGHEMVGTVEQGPAKWMSKRVVGEINCVCRSCDMCQAGLSNHCRRRTVMGIDGRDGCFADLLVLPERNLHEVPDNISDEEAVFVEPLAAAWQVVRQVPIETGARVAVLGTGRLGLLVAQVINTFDCDLEAIGRNEHSMLLCEKRHIRTSRVDDVPLRNDRDVVVECTGSPEGLQTALGLVRPRGTIVLKSTYATDGGINLAPLVINEVTVVGSRCGPFGDAIQSLSKKQVDVLPMISRSMKIDRAVEAFEAAADRKNVKILLKINP